MKNIGNPVKLRSTGDGATDPGNVINAKFRQYMNVVDLIPVDWKLDLSGFTTTANKYVTYLDFDQQIEKYKEDCGFYGLTEQRGLRCWLTGESIFQEEIGNEFQENLISQKLNSLSDMVRSVAALKTVVKSGGGDLGAAAGSLGETGQAAADAASAAAAETQEKLNGVLSLMPKNWQGAIGTSGKIIKDIMVEGKHTSLPKIWHATNYNPSLSLNIQLISPYGDKKSILENVIKPLTYLYILAAPRTTDGITYGKPRYVYMKGYGVSNINLGYIESLSISRGGEDVTYNRWRQPLSVNIAMSIKPAADGFAIVDPEAAILGGLEEFNVNDISEPEKLINPGSAFATVGTILSSFRPIGRDVVGADASPPSNDTIAEAAKAFEEAFPKPADNTEAAAANKEAADKIKETATNITKDFGGKVEKAKAELAKAEKETIRLGKRVATALDRLANSASGSSQEHLYEKSLDKLEKLSLANAAKVTQLGNIINNG
jgi:hypothetical protein